ncbi:unnamed protein product [Pleuronectes platessa]|uniref:Uncharacterized protein n=1 Tax=Pleuronectes platessa TaxID=8262 RepID=A0A9N7VP17_PLEPL|nr:unnamed protein product [Pleuronectes platessa]
MYVRRAAGGGVTGSRSVCGLPGFSASRTRGYFTCIIGAFQPGAGPQLFKHQAAGSDGAFQPPCLWSDACTEPDKAPRNERSHSDTSGGTVSAQPMVLGGKACRPPNELTQPDQPSDQKKGEEEPACLEKREIRGLLPFPRPSVAAVISRQQGVVEHISS